MSKDELIQLTDKWLKSAAEIRECIRLIDIVLKKDTYDMGIVDKLKQEHHRLHSKLSGIIKAIAKLKEEDQRIICYRYFEELSYSKIALRVGYTNKTIAKKIDRLLLDVGRIIFGYEDEFWKQFED